MHPPVCPTPPKQYEDGSYLIEEWLYYMVSMEEYFDDVREYWRHAKPITADDIIRRYD